MGVALFGGSFNPFHNGHLSIAKDLVDHLDLHELKILPSGQPPHKLRNLASNKHRLKMIELGIKNHLNSISLEEFELNNKTFQAKIGSFQDYDILSRRGLISTYRYLVRLGKIN